MFVKSSIKKQQRRNQAQKPISLFGMQQRHPSSSIRKFSTCSQKLPHKIGVCTDNTHSFLHPTTMSDVDTSNPTNCPRLEAMLKRHRESKTRDYVDYLGEVMDDYDDFRHCDDCCELSCKRIYETSVSRHRDECRCQTCESWRVYCYCPTCKKRGCTDPSPYY